MLGGALPTLAAPLAEQAAAIDRPQVGERVTLAEPLRLGRGSIRPAGGTAVHLLTARGERCGLLVAGPAEFSYRVEDRFSVPVARRNLRSASSLQVQASGAGLEIREQLQSAVIWGWEAAGAPPAAAAPADARDSPQPAFPKWAADLLESFTASPPAHELLLARANSGSGLSYALLQGTRERFWLVVDPFESGREILATLWKLPQSHPDSGLVVPMELVSQPIARTWWDPPVAQIVAEHLTLRVDNDRAQHVVITTRARLRAIKAGQRLWRAVLVEQLREGDDVFPVTVKSVTIAGAPADWLHRNSELLVALPRALAAGDTVEVDLVTEGDIARRPNNDNYWVLGTWPWYPQPGSLDGERATVEIQVRAPAPFLPFASGSVVARSESAGFHELRTRFSKPMQRPVVAAGKFHVISDQRGEQKANVAAYAFAKERESRRLLDNFLQAAEFFANLLGEPYPFDELHVLEINTVGFGQAPPGVIFITKEAFNAAGMLRVEGLEDFTVGVNHRYLHEIAHGWWGHVIKWGSLEEQWLSESFAEYTAALAMAAAQGGAKAAERELEGQIKAWRGRAAYIGDNASIYFANHLAGREDRDALDRVYLLYAKGPLVLHALRLELRRQRGSAEEGDRHFFALLRSFIKNFRYQSGATRHLVGILEQMTGEAWQPWFERYVYGAEMPPLG